MTRSILRRLGYLSFFGVCQASLMLMGVIPIKEWFEVRDTKEELLVELKEIEELNESYIIAIDDLNTDEEIERIAREDHGLVKPYEEAYYVVPVSEGEMRIPGVWPFHSS